MNIEKHFKILNLSINASLEDVKRAYRKKALKYHPDLVQNNSEVNKFHQINESYQYLIKYKTNKLDNDSFQFYSESYYTDIYADPIVLEVDLEYLSCNCNDWLQNRKEFLTDDPRRLCRHLIRKLYRNTNIDYYHSYEKQELALSSSFLRFSKALLNRIDLGFFLWKEKIELEYFTIFVYYWDSFETSEPKPLETYSILNVTNIDIFAKKFDNEPIWIGYDLQSLRWSNNRPRIRSLKTIPLPNYIEEVKLYISKRFKIDKRYLDFPYSDRYLLSKYKNNRKISIHQFYEVLIQEKLIIIENKNKILTEKGKVYGWIPYDDYQIVWYEDRFSDLLDMIDSKMEFIRKFEKNNNIKSKPMWLEESCKTCPHCESDSIIKKGIRSLKNHKIQRYRCQSCNKIFSENI